MYVKCTCICSCICICMFILYLNLYVHLHLHLYFCFTLHPSSSSSRATALWVLLPSLLLARLLCLFLVRNSGYKPYLISLPPPSTLPLCLSLSVILACLLCVAETVALDSVSDSDANVTVAAATERQQQQRRLL